MKKYKQLITIIALLAMLPAPMLAQDASQSYVKSADSTDYLLGGALTLKNGRIDKYQFEEGYCQAARRSATQDVFTVLYYDRDHLGNIRQVTKDDGTQSGKVVQRMDYYPFGAQLCDGTTDGNYQQHCIFLLKCFAVRVNLLIFAPNLKLNQKLRHGTEKWRKTTEQAHGGRCRAKLVPSSSQ